VTIKVDLDKGSDAHLEMVETWANANLKK